MDDYSLGVLEACFYFQEAIEELVKDEEAKKALQERINLLIERIRRKSAKTLPTRLLPP